MGLNEPEIINLNKSRQRAIYLRPDGRGGYVKTTPLPADPASINYYFLKGFRSPPREEDGVLPLKDKTSSSVVDGKLLIKCPLCEFNTQSAFGLQAHLRKHINKEGKENV